MPRQLALAARRASARAAPGSAGRGPLQRQPGAGHASLALASCLPSCLAARLGGGLAGTGQQRHAERLAHLVLDLARELGVLAQELARVVLALADLLAVVGVPGAGLVDDAGVDAQVDDLALAADALAVEDVELGRLERRRDLVLDDLDLGLVADDLVALLDAAGAADVQPHRGVELQRVAAGGGLGVAEHDADLHADLVDEDDHAVGLLDRGGELAQRLAHQPRLQAGQRIAHLAFELGLGRQRGHRVDDDQVDRAGAHQRVDDLERLLAGVGLADQQFLQVDAELLRVLRVERVLGVDEGAGAAELLHLGDDLQRQRGLARATRGRRSRPRGRAAGRRRRARCPGPASRWRRPGCPRSTSPSPRRMIDALAELLFDLRERGLQGLGFFGVQGFDGCVHGGLLGWSRLWQKLDVCTVMSSGARRGCAA